MSGKFTTACAVTALIAGGGATALPAQAAPTAPAATAAQPAVAAAPAKSKYKTCDIWDGTWLYSSEVGDGTYTDGRMELGVYNHDRAAGEYMASTSGFIKGDITNLKHPDRLCGNHWEGTFKDRSGQHRNKGKFWATLDKEGGVWRFFGQYCVKSTSFPYLCGDWYTWGGTKVD